MDGQIGILEINYHMPGGAKKNWILKPFCFNHTSKYEEMLLFRA
jgi:hypothetical protein